MAEELGVEVSDVVEGGTALAFVAYPTAITKEFINSRVGEYLSIVIIALQKLQCDKIDIEITYFNKSIKF